MGPPASSAPRYSWDARSSHCIAPVYQLGTPWGHAFGGNVKYVDVYVDVYVYMYVINPMQCNVMQRNVMYCNVV
jgi:hypothetical protein